MSRRARPPAGTTGDGTLSLWAEEQPSGSTDPSPAGSVHPVPAGPSRPREKRAIALVDTLDGLPLMMTVTEAAVVLRISRTTAYKLVELHRTTKGRAGLPHVRLGNRVLVRRVDLAEIVGLPADTG